MAKRKTMPQVLRSRFAVSYSPRASICRSSASNSRAVISATGRLPKARNAKLNSHRFLSHVSATLAFKFRKHFLGDVAEAAIGDRLCYLSIEFALRRGIDSLCQKPLRLVSPTASFRKWDSRIDA